MEATILIVVAAAYLYLTLWARKNWRKSKRDERNARDRYEITGELDEQIKQRRK